MRSRRFVVSVGQWEGREGSVARGETICTEGSRAACAAASGNRDPVRKSRDIIEPNRVKNFTLLGSHRAPRRCHLSCGRHFGLLTLHLNRFPPRLVQDLEGSSAKMPRSM